MKEHLFDLEKDTGAAGAGVEEGVAIYVVYPDEAGGNWRIQAVPVSPSSFESRKALPEPWRGIRDEELSKLTGIEGGIFVHASGFIGGKCCSTPVATLMSDLLQVTRPGRGLWRWLAKPLHSECCSYV